MIVPSIHKRPRQSTKCPHCKTELEFEKPSATTLNSLAPEETLQIKCAECLKVFEGPKEEKKSMSVGKSRRIGTDDNPLETYYYDLLEVKTNATLAEIKSAYRRLAIKWHPDKRPGDLEAEEKFKQIALAYNTLSDPELRRKYNEFGRANQADEGFVDPEAVFSTLFGGERFADIIGTISIGAEMKTALQEEEEDPTKKPTGPLTEEQKKEKEQKDKEKKEKERIASEERAKVRETRVAKLTETLKRKLQVFTEQATDEYDTDVAVAVRTMWSIERDELQSESYGVELLQTVGFVYSAKAKHYTASASTPFGLGGWLHSARSTAHVFSETFSTLRAAMDLRAVFQELTEAEKAGISDEKRAELEAKAAQKGLEALFKGAKLEVESVIREVCDRLLGEAGLSPGNLKKRAAALGILGEVYMLAKKESEPGQLNGSDSEYVKIETKRQSQPTPATPTASGKAKEPSTTSPSVPRPDDTKDSAEGTTYSPKYADHKPSRKAP